MYTKAFKALMVRKMADPNGASPMSIAKDIGVSRSTLYRWVSEIDTVDIAGLPGIAAGTTSKIVKGKCLIHLGPDTPVFVFQWPVFGTLSSC